MPRLLPELFRTVGVSGILLVCVFASSLLNATALYGETECKSPDAQVVDYGIYKATSAGEREETEGTASGYTTVISGTKLIRKTTDIPGNLGSQFGFRYALECENEDAGSVPVTIKIFHPKMTNPRSGEASKESSWTDEAWTSQPNIHSGWVFEESWEVVPGQYRIQVLLEGRVLIEKSFNVEVGSSD